MRLNTLFKHWSYRLFAPGTMLRERYEALKRLLNYDALCHEQMAEFQDMLQGGRPEDLVSIRKRFTLFSSRVAGMIDALETMAPGSYASLKSYHKKFDFYTRFLLAPPKMEYSPPFVLALDEIGPESKQIGNKAKHLALLKNELDMPVPSGFAVTSGGYHYLIEYNDLRGPIDELLDSLNIFSPRSLADVSDRLQELVLHAEIPAALEEEILATYDRLLSDRGTVRTAVRSSAISEDSGFSFAGQYTTLLDVEREGVCRAYLEVIASKYAQEALFYRISHGLGDEETAMSVLVQEMVPAACSGVLYTRSVLRDQEAEVMELHVTSGLGERLVGGLENPEHHYLLGRDGGQPVLLSEVEAGAILAGEQAVEIGIRGLIIERYFKTAQDIEWAMDKEGRLRILQARELHIDEREEACTAVDESVHVLLAGCERASTGVAVGQVCRVDDTGRLEGIPDGAVLVLPDSPPEYVKLLNRAVAVLAERGSRASHFATVAREFGVPYLTGIESGCEKLEDGAVVTVDGDRGAVYAGRVEQLLQKGGGDKKTVQSKVFREGLKFVTPLELVDASADNFTPEGCRSMHDIIRFCHEKGLHAMFSTGRPGTGRGALRLVGNIPLDVFLFDVGGGFSVEVNKRKSMPLTEVASIPFRALWKGLSHPGVQWKQKPFDWEAYDKIELAGGVPPKKDSFAFASYAVVGADYLHFNIRFGYHFTIVDALCTKNTAENYCMLRFAGGGGDYDHRLLRIDFIVGVLQRIGFVVEQKGDLLEARLQGMDADAMLDKLDLLGRLLGATKLMDMVLEGPQMVAEFVEDFFQGRYSFSEEG